MTQPLRWRDAPRQDRMKLQRFVCTSAQPAPAGWRAKQRPAQAPTWEREVQASIRTSTPPAGPRDWLLLGEAGDELAAVVWAEQSSGPGEVYVQCIAVATAYQRQGFGVAAYEEIRERAMERADDAGESHATIWWYVDRRNKASETLCERLGAIHHRQAHDRFDRWSISYDLTPR